MLTYRCAAPAVRTPAGRVPGMERAPRVRSRQPHGQNHAPGLFHAIAQRGAHHVDPPLLCEFQNRGVRPQLHPGFGEHPEKTPGILRTGELLLEIVKAEAAVDALVQDAARLPVPLHH